MAKKKTTKKTTSKVAKKKESKKVDTPKQAAQKALDRADIHPNQKVQYSSDY